MTLEPSREPAPAAPEERIERPPAAARLRAVPGLAVVARHLGVIVSVAAVAGFVLWALGQDTPKFPSDPADIALVGGAVLVYAFATAVRGWRWHRIMRHNGIPHSRTDAYMLCVVGYACNNVLPARGGELLRIYLMGQRSGARKREVLGTVLAERVLDAVSLALLLVILSVGRVAGSSPGDSRTLAAVGALVVVSTVFVIAMLLHRGERLQRVMGLLRPIMAASRRLVSPYGAILLVVTMGIWALEGTIFWMIGRSLGIAITPWEGLFVLVLSGFFTLIPAAPGYVGTFEAGVLVGLSRLGVSGGTAVAFALLVRFVMYVPITVVGLGFLIARYGGLQLLRSRRWEQPA